MQNVSENAADAVEMPEQHPRLVSQIFRDYRNNFGLFWQVMFPLIIVNFLLYIGIFLFFKLVSPEGQWTVSTASGIAGMQDAVHTPPPESVEPASVTWRMSLGPSGVHISLLWLAMCPLALAMVQRHNGINLTFKTVWQQTLRKTAPILGAAFLIGMFASGVPLIAGFLISETLAPAYSSTLFPVFMAITVVWFVFTIYFVVKWSLYNQGIILDDLSVIAALRRSSELVRGVWWALLRLYLLLVWASTVLTSLLLSLTVVLLSFAVPELVPMREVLQPMHLLSLLLCGYGEMTLTTAPSFWIIGAIVGVHTLIHAILAPIWAILTTYLYVLQRTAENEQQVSA